MRQVWKWELSPDCDLEMPVGAKILDIQYQHDSPCLWALVDPKAPVETRHIKTFGTGHDIPNEPVRFLGTFQMAGGNLIFHVFEVKS